jgi:hypothetical protein
MNTLASIMLIFTLNGSPQITLLTSASVEACGSDLAAAYTALTAMGATDIVGTCNVGRIH